MTHPETPPSETDRQQLVARELLVRNRQRLLLSRTSIHLTSGELVALVGDPGHGHTALALALAGRLVPDEGEILLTNDTSRRHLRSAVALVDVPGVSEPDDAVPATTIVAEELAMAGHRAGRTHVRTWLTDHGLDHLHGLEMQDVTPPDRVVLLAQLAALRTPAFLVVVLPERHGALPADWTDPLLALAATGPGVAVTTSIGVGAHVPTSVPRLHFGSISEAAS